MTLSCEQSIRLGLQDGGREVSVRLGEKVILELPENPTTGFIWSGLDKENFDFEDLPQKFMNPDAVGAASMRMIRLIPKSTGRFTVTLLRSRAWEPDANADARFEVDLVVSE